MARPDSPLPEGGTRRRRRRRRARHARSNRSPAATGSERLPTSSRSVASSLGQAAMLTKKNVGGQASEKRQKKSDIWQGFSILKKDGGCPNSVPRCGSLLAPFDPDFERKAHPDFDGARRYLAMTIIATGQSLSLVEGYPFQQFVRGLNPQFPLSRSSLDQDVKDLYEKEKDTLHCIISEAPGGLSFAVDKWRSKETGDNFNDDIYLCVTACFVDADWKLQRRVVGFKLMEFPDDAMSIAETVALCFSELNVDKKVISITLDKDAMDNVYYEASMADSLKSALHDKCNLLCCGELCQVQCCTDILNSVVQAGIELIADIIGKIRHGIHYITYSSITKDAFYQCAKDIFHLDVTMKLRADLVVTWDSTYKMLVCALYYRDALSHFALTDETFLSEFHLSDEEWHKVAVMEKFLKPVYDITHTFISTKCKTANLYFLGVYKVYRLLKVTRKRKNFMSSMVKDMKAKFDKYWSECSLILACAAALDPRYKLKLIRYCFRKVHGDAVASKHTDSVVALLHRLFADYKKTSDSSSAGSNVVEYHAKDNLFDDYIQQEQTSELDWYLKSPAIDLNHDLDILEFWSGMSKCYPELGNLARDILSIPISTVASKSAFTTGEKVINGRRCSLSPDLLEMLTCLHDWTCPKDRNGIPVSAIEGYCTDEDEEDIAASDDDQDEENME